MKTLKKLTFIAAFLLLATVLLAGSVFAYDGDSNVLTTTPTYGNATITGGTIRLRTAPSFTGDVIGVVNTGTRVQVNGLCDDWYETVVNDSIGYIYAEYIIRDGVSKVFTVEVEEPAPAAVEAAPAAEPVTVTTTQTQETVYVDPNYVPGASIETAQPAAAPAATAAPAPAPAATPAPTPAPAVQSTPSFGVSGQTIVNTAMQYVGVPYVWAGTSPETGFDCSGLVYFVYGQYGITLNRVAQAMYYNGTAADLGNLQPGDILLFGSSTSNIWHAGIYVGNGNFIHSPHSGRTVCVESIASCTGLRLVAARHIV